MRARRRIAIVTSWYPTEANPVGGIFVQDQANVLSRVAQVAVIAPRFVSWRRVARDPSTWRRRDEVPTVGFPVLRPLVPVMNRAPTLTSLITEKVVMGSLRELASAWGGIDVVNAQVVLPAGAAAIRAAKRLGIPTILTEHSSPFAAHLSTATSRRAVEEALTGASRVVAVGQHLRDEIRAVIPVPIDVIGNVIADAFFRVPIAPRPVGRTLHLLAVGFLVPQKGFADLLAALAAAALEDGDVELVIVGDGPERPNLEARADELALTTRVRFEPATDRAGLVAWLRWADALVSASHHESFGLVVAEALAAGKPVVTTASGGPDQYMNPRLGMVVPPNDIPALAEAIRLLPSFLATFDGEGARRVIEATFGPSAFIAAMTSVLDQIDDPAEPARIM